MKAALVNSFESPPHFGEANAPIPGEDELLVTVSAAALSPLVRSQAAGKHYSSVAIFPSIPGNDGVGWLEDTQRVYFLASRPGQGSMAEMTVARTRACIPLPDGLDDITAAGIANPGMSSWAALTSRAKLQQGETVLIHGATGSAGRMAIQIAKLLGAGKVIAVGRNQKILDTLCDIGADEVFSIGRDEEEIIRGIKTDLVPGGIDVVLDYLWGVPAERLLNAFVGHGRAQGEPRVRFVQIGASAGPTISLPGATLRSSGLELMGSGLGSVAHADLLASINDLFHAALTTRFSIETEAVPLAEVESAWTRDTGERRLVFTVT